MLYYSSLFRLTQSLFNLGSFVTNLALLRLCVFWGALLAEIWWRGAPKHFSGPGIKAQKMWTYEKQDAEWFLHYLSHVTTYLRLDHYCFSEPPFPPPTIYSISPLVRYFYKYITISNIFLQTKDFKDCSTTHY